MWEMVDMRHWGPPYIKGPVYKHISSSSVPPYTTDRPTMALTYTSYEGSIHYNSIKAEFG